MTQIQNQSSSQIEAIECDGTVLVEDVLSHSECAELIGQLDRVMADDAEHQNVLESRGTVFAARNIIEIFPEVTDVWRRPKLVQLLSMVLGDKFGLVRVLYFDKPSNRSWTLPFHKDMTIAVVDNQAPSTQFCKPTNKAGVPHVEASEELLNNMLTLRIHLDPVTEDNGPLKVIPGSHLNGKSAATSTAEPITVLCGAGDVLAMRPLISHASGHSNPDKMLNRRILHFEFSGWPTLPDEYQWQHFIR